MKNIKIPENVLLLLHGNNFVDMSPYKRTVNNSNVMIDTTHKHFTKYNSFMFGGSTGGSATSFYVENLINNAMEFTIDFWYYTDSTAYQQCFWSHGGSNQSWPYGGMLSYSYASRGWGLNYYCYGQRIQNDNMAYTGAWHHIAFEYDGEKFLLFWDGVLQGTCTNAMTFSTSVERFGWNDSGSGEHCYGYMQELCVRRGCVWKSDFTPPTEPYDYEVTTDVYPDSSGEIHRTDVSETTYSDDKKWEWRRYGKGATYPELVNYPDSLAYNALNYYDDASISSSWYLADSYTARCTTYAYFSADTTVSISVRTDDGGNWYLNGTHVVTSPSCSWTGSTWNFKAGWNKVQCLYTEGGGADGWEMSPRLYTFAEKLGSTVTQKDYINFKAIPYQRYSFSNWNPSEYVALDYIESSGTQYINTGVYSNKGLSVDLDFSVLSTTGNGIIIGSAWTSAALLVHCNSGNNLTCYWGSGVTVPYTKNVKHNLKISPNKYVLDDTTTYTTSGSPSSFGNLLLMGGASYYAYCRIYHCRIWQGNELVRDLIPAMQVRTGDIGLYDAIESKFYKNAGSGEFKWGYTEK